MLNRLKVVWHVIQGKPVIYRVNFGTAAVALSENNRQVLVIEDNVIMRSEGDTILLPH